MSLTGASGQEGGLRTGPTSSLARQGPPKQPHAGTADRIRDPEAGDPVNQTSPKLR